MLFRRREELLPGDELRPPGVTSRTPGGPPLGVKGRPDAGVAHLLGDHDPPGTATTTPLPTQGHGVCRAMLRRTPYAVNVRTMELPP